MDDLHEIMTFKKFGTNLGGRAFFFFGFTHRPIIETANSFVLNTLLPCRRERFAPPIPRHQEKGFGANCMVTDCVLTM